jgi:REP element-mobilizing transposase RayT
LLEILAEEVRKLHGIPIRHNAMPDHVHLLAQLPPTATVSDFIGKVKGATSYRVNKELNPKFRLHWQEGYGVISVRKGEIEKVGRYIYGQEEHHKRGKLSDILERLEGEEGRKAEASGQKPP